MRSDAPDVPEQRILEAAAHLPPDGVVTGWAACRLHGGGFFDGLDRDGRTLLPVPLVVGVSHGTRPRPGVTVCRDPLAPTDVVVRHGVPCAVPERAVFDAMRWAADLREAVVVCDSALSAQVATFERLSRYVDGKSGWQGVQRVRDALPWVSGRVRSPAESRFRLLWIFDAGLAVPLVNCPVADAAGRFLAEVDLLDPLVGLVGEYDGADHRTGARHAQDVRREDALRRVGLELVTVTGRDFARPGLVVERIRAARDRAALIPADRKTFLIKRAAQTRPRQPD